MLVRNFTQKQINAVFRSSNKFSVLAATEEFPHSAPATKKSTAAPVVTSTTLPNGARLVVRERESPIATVKFAVVGGSSVETAAQKGAAQFLATAAYSGDKNNTAARTIKQLEKLGVKYTATADREKIVYSATFLANQAEEVLKTYLSILASPAADADFLEEYRATAKLAYEALHANGEAQVLELVHEAAFGETSPLGSSFFAANADDVSVAEALKYRNQQFVASNVVIAADGVPADLVKSVATPLLDLFPAGAATKLPGSAYVGGESKVRADLSGATQVAVAFPVPAGAAGKATAVVQGLLATKLADKKVAATPFIFNYSSGGIFGFTAKGQPAAVEATLAAAVGELKAIAADATGAEGAKAKVTVANFEALESTAGTGKFVDAVLANESAVALADARGVSAADVAAAAKAALKATPSYAVYGTTAGVPSYSAVAKLLA